MGESRLARNLLCAALLGCAVLGPTGAWAAGASLEAATEQQKAAATDAYNRGRDAMTAGKMEEALAAFRSSYDIVASPNPHFMVVRVLAELNRNAEAYAECEKVVIEADRAAAKEDRYKQTAQHAHEKLGELRGKLAFVTVHVDAPPGATLEIGGRPIPQEDWGKPIAVDPGTVAVVLTTATGPSRRELQLAAGAKESVTMQGTTAGGEGEIAAEGEGEEGEGEGNGGDTGTSSGGGSGLLVASGVAFGVGGLGMILFGVFGGLTLKEFSDVEETCERGCNASQSDIAEDGKNFQTAANITVIIGAIGLAAGAGCLIGYLTQDNGSDTAIRVGPGSVSLSGRF